MKLIKESIQKNLKLYSNILSKINEQNSDVIDDVDDIMQEVKDCWGSNIVPGYDLLNSVDETYIELNSKDFFDYMGYNEEDFEELDDIYKHTIDYVSKIRDGYYKDLTLRILYQFPNELNDWKPFELNDDKKKILGEVVERLKHFNCKVEYEYQNLSLWSMKLFIPVKLNIPKKINKFDGASNKFIKDFDSFVNDYKIDDKGVDRLTNLIRSFKKQ